MSLNTTVTITGDLIVEPAVGAVKDAVGAGGCPNEIMVLCPNEIMALSSIIIKKVYFNFHCFGKCINRANKFEEVAFLGFKYKAFY